MDGDMKDLLSEACIFPRGRASSDVEAIRFLGRALEDAGYIDGAYTEAAVEREAAFPTGIALAKGAVALPHATPAGMVKKNGIGIVRLEEPVVFHSMEDPDETVKASIVFMLALAGEHAHLSMLQKLFGLFRQEGAIEALLAANGADEIKEIVERALA